MQLGTDSHRLSDLKVGIALHIKGEVDRLDRNRRGRGKQVVEDAASGFKEACLGRDIGVGVVVLAVTVASDTLDAVDDVVLLCDSSILGSAIR